MTYAVSADVGHALARLRELLEELPVEWRALPEKEAAGVARDGAWTPKQIVGHLIDSAGVNQQRFTRGQLDGERGFHLEYPQDEFVQLNGYQQRPWADLIALWEALNRQLLHTAERIPPGRLDRPCGVGEEDWSLRFRIADYVAHLEHHVRQIRAFGAET